MRTCWPLPTGREACLSDPGIPGMPTYRVLHIEGEAPVTPDDEAALFVLARKVARQLAEETLGDPEGYSLLYNGGRTRRVAAPHVHLLPAGSVPDKHRALWRLSVKGPTRSFVRRLAGLTRPIDPVVDGALNRAAALVARGRGLAADRPPLDLDAIATRFAADWRAIGAVGPAGPAFDRLAARYQHPSRHYHTLHHVLALRDGLETTDEPVGDAAALALAIWYHDAVQVPLKGGDEHRSARLARQVLTAAEVSPARIDAVAALIEATAHASRAPEDSDADLLLDLDLAVLGASPENYDAYARAVRAEYAWLPDTLWREGRMRVVDTFIARPSIYRTPSFKARLESRARANLAREKARLSISSY